MPSRSRAVAVLLAVSVGVTACAGSEQGAPLGGVETEAAPSDVEPASTSTGDSSVRRELGLALRPDAEVSTNLLPPVEVHDVGQDRMVNFKNIFPAEQPVLLWMWAPF